MKYLALDVGNVLVNVNFKSFIQDLSKQLNITLEEAEYFMNRTHSLHDVGLTKMADELRDHFKIKSPLIVEDLIESWNNVITPDFDMIKFFNNMRIMENVKIALLSNVGLEHAAQMGFILDYENFFNYSVKHLSCFVGARKPTKLYYQSFLMQHPEFEGCSYLDDLEENLKASELFGFRPYHFELEHHPLECALQQPILDNIKQFILEGK